MITEDYVSFETAKLLKEKGFDVWGDGSFGTATKIWKEYSPSGKLNDCSMGSPSRKAFPAPTLQMAMKWLREVHNKIIVPGISLDDRTSSTINHYTVGIWYIPENNGGAFCFTPPIPYSGYPSFEEACEAAIKYCLKNLI